MKNISRVLKLSKKPPVEDNEPAAATLADAGVAGSVVVHAKASSDADSESVVSVLQGTPKVVVRVQEVPAGCDDDDDNNDKDDEQQEQPGADDDGGEGARPVRLRRKGTVLSRYFLRRGGAADVDEPQENAGTNDDAAAHTTPGPTPNPTPASRSNSRSCSSTRPQNSSASSAASSCSSSSTKPSRRRSIKKILFSPRRRDSSDDSDASSSRSSSTSRRRHHQNAAPDIGTFHAIDGAEADGSSVVAATTHDGGVLYFNPLPVCPEPQARRRQAARRRSSVLEPILEQLAESSDHIPAETPVISLFDADYALPPPVSLTQAPAPAPVAEVSVVAQVEATATVPATPHLGLQMAPEVPELPVSQRPALPEIILPPLRPMDPELQAEIDRSEILSRLPPPSVIERMAVERTLRLHQMDYIMQQPAPHRRELLRQYCQRELALPDFETVDPTRMWLPLNREEEERPVQRPATAGSPYVTSYGLGLGEASAEAGNSSESLVSVVSDAILDAEDVVEDVTLYVDQNAAEDSAHSDEEDGEPMRRIFRLGSDSDPFADSDPYFDFSARSDAASDLDSEEREVFEIFEVFQSVEYEYAGSVARQDEVSEQLDESDEISEEHDTMSKLYAQPGATDRNFEFDFADYESAVEGYNDDEEDYYSCFEHDPTPTPKPRKTYAFFEYGLSEDLPEIKFEELPNDIHYQISQFLMGPDLKSMGQVSARLRPIYANLSWVNCVVVAGVFVNGLEGLESKKDSSTSLASYSSHVQLSRLERRYEHLKKRGTSINKRFIVPEIVTTKHTRCIPVQIFLNPEKYSWFFNHSVRTLFVECTFVPTDEPSEQNLPQLLYKLTSQYTKLQAINIGYNAFSIQPTPNNPNPALPVGGYEGEVTRRVDRLFLNHRPTELDKKRDKSTIVYSLLNSALMNRNRGHRQHHGKSIFDVQLILDSEYYFISLPSKSILRTLDVGFFFDINIHKVDSGIDFSEFENVETLKIVFKRVTYYAHEAIVHQVLCLERLRKFSTSVNPWHDPGNDNLPFAINNWVNLLRNLSLLCSGTNKHLLPSEAPPLEEFCLSGAFEPIDEDRELTEFAGCLYFPQVTEVITDSVEIFKMATFGPKLRSLKIFDNVGLPDTITPNSCLTRLSNCLGGSLTSLSLHCLEGTRAVPGMIALLNSDLVKSLKMLTLNIEYRYNVFSAYTPPLFHHTDDGGSGARPRNPLQQPQCHHYNRDFHEMPGAFPDGSPLRKLCAFLNVLPTETLVGSIDLCVQLGISVEELSEFFFTTYGGMMVEQGIDRYAHLLSALCIHPLTNLSWWNTRSVADPIDVGDYHLYMASFVECVFDAVAHNLKSLEYLRINAIGTRTDRPMWKYVTASLRFNEFFMSYLDTRYSDEVDKPRDPPHLMQDHALKQLFINDLVPMDPNDYCTCMRDSGYEYACEMAYGLPMNYTSVLRSVPPVDTAILLDFEARRRGFAGRCVSYDLGADNLIYMNRLYETEGPQTVFKSTTISNVNRQEYHDFDGDDRETTGVEGWVY